MIFNSSLISSTRTIAIANTSNSSLFISRLTCQQLINSNFANSTFKNHLSPFQAIFGIDARQTSAVIKISKSSFTKLQPLVNNTAESLLVSLLLRLFAFTDYSNEKIYSYFWGINFPSGKVNHILIIKLLNKLTPIDIYELPEVDNIVRIGDY